tara:strand:+ start:175 stop:504 length:330 start_codon:yes stop_codon:yes gene_type:complete
MAKFINKLKLYCLDKGKTEEEFNSKVQCQNDGKGDWISYWDLDIDKPTDEQLNALESDAIKLENNNKIRATRRNLYGNIGDQLDEIFKNIDDWKARIKKIKDDNPKESS